MHIKCQKIHCFFKKKDIVNPNYLFLKSVHFIIWLRMKYNNLTNTTNYFKGYQSRLSEQVTYAVITL